MKKHLAGIIPVSGVKTDFNMPWHESLMPIAPNYLAIERSVLECAYAGCNTIWIVCNDDVTPLIRYQVGEVIQDPVYNYRHFEHNKKDFKRPIRIYYTPLNIRDINKRDNLAWSALHGAKIADKILRNISSHLKPDKFWISWPYGYCDPRSLREARKEIDKGHLMLSYKGQTAKHNLHLGMTLDKEQIDQLILESKTRSTGMWVDPETRKQRYSLKERFSYKNFTLQEVFETLQCSSYRKLEIEEYYNLDNWSDYCHFLSLKPSIKKPKILNAKEWNGIGIDEEV
tara:strand:+ start:10109 stop:10963 length:855 start_codon:yes stop_codon:yes gene_type:complete